jgi:hypothetical protein
LPIPSELAALTCYRNTSLTDFNDKKRGMLQGFATDLPIFFEGVGHTANSAYFTE